MIFWGLDLLVNTLDACCVWIAWCDDSADALCGVCRDDPRFPTVRGVLRRGMTVEGLKEFVIGQVGAAAHMSQRQPLWLGVDPRGPCY